MKIYCLLFLFLTTVAGQVLFNDVKNGGSEGNPGMVIHMTRLGINYIQALGTEVLNEQLPKLRIPDRTQKIDEGKITIKNSRVVEYLEPKRSDLFLNPPNRATFRVQGMGMKVRGKFDGTYKVVLVPIRSHGNFELIIEGLSHQQDIFISATSEGQPQVRSGPCQVQIQRVLVTIRNSGFLMDLTLNTFKQMIADKVKPMLEEEICSTVTKMIDTDANKLLATYPLTIPLGASGFGTFQDLFGKSDSKNASSGTMILDYRMMGQPRFEQDSATIPVKGEISWEGKGGTPFNPPPIGGFPSRSSKMMYIHASDFLLNSLLYHSYSHNRLKFKFNRYTQPKIGDMLRTTCDDGFSFCLGDLVDSFANAFPDHDVEMLFTPEKVPAFLFRQGRIQVLAEGLYTMAVVPVKRRGGKSFSAEPNVVVWSELSFEADVTVAMKRGKMKMTGKFSIVQMQNKLRRSKVKGFDQATLDTLTDFATDALNEEATKLLQTGMPLPDVKGMRWRPPAALRSDDRYLIIKSWFQLNKNIIGNLIGSAASNFG